MRSFILLLLCLAEGFFCSNCFGVVGSHGIVLLVNSNDESSLKVARYYAQKRAVPERNIIAISCSKDEEISWDVYVNEILNPLRGELIRSKWINAKEVEEKDKFGRYNLTPESHKIDFLVICKGVPLKIRNEDRFLTRDEKEAGKTNYLMRTYASVDSELSMMASAEYPLVGFIPNPLYRVKEPKNDKLKKVIRVMRLDGPTENDVMRLIDHALEAEEKGLQGRAYIDAAGPYSLGNTWLLNSGKRIRGLGFDTFVKNEKGKLINIGERFDAPAIYLGWWTGNPVGPLAERDLKFPPGAIAIHIHSFSASTVRSSRKAWVGPLVAHGATATVGNVYEPLLGLSANVEFLWQSLIEGKSWGEAAYFALPSLSWQGVVIGDPLYQPFKHSLDKQLEDLRASPTPYGPYVAIRKMNLLLDENRLSEAISFGEEAFSVVPGLALGYALAVIYEMQGDRENAIQALAFAAKLSFFEEEEQILAKDIADYLLNLGDKTNSLLIYKILLEQSDVSDERRKIILSSGIKAATKAGRFDLSQAWNAEKTEL